MKQLLLMAVFCQSLLVPHSAGAQYLMSSGRDTSLPKMEFGLKAGLQLNTISGESWDQSIKPGLAGGIYAGMYKRNFGVRIEVVVNTARYTSKDTAIVDSNGNKGDFRATYISIPLLLEFRVAKFLWVQAGPQYNNLMSVKSLNNLSENGKILFKANEFSGVVGFEGRFPENISGGIRAIFGLTDINNQVVSTEAWKNTSVQVYVGYRIK